MGFVPAFRRLNDGKPLLQCVATHPWENRVAFNPGCAFVDDNETLNRIIPHLPFDGQTQRALRRYPALCFLLYRAQGATTPAHDYSRSSVGLAVLSPTLDLLARYTEPVVLPDQGYDDLGVEDVRLTRVGPRFVMSYTAYGSSQPQNRIRIALASTQDFVHWEKHGLLKGVFNEVDNKNAMLFPEQVNGKYLMLHRPMEGPDRMCIHWAESDEILGSWRSRGTLMKPISNPSFVDTWIGGGAPPLKLSDGRFLILYHIGNRKADGTREYDLGIAIGDPRRQEFIVRRDEPFLRPSTPAEMTGDAQLGVNNVVFVCGAYFYRGDLYVPYAGADSVVLAGMIQQEDIERYLS